MARPRLATSSAQAAPDPLAARDAGYRTIEALQQAGDDAGAARYAVASPDGMRRDLVIAAYFSWGGRTPDAAWPSAIAITDPAARETALQAVLSGWARQSPDEMAEASLAFPAGAEKDAALTKAMRAWLVKDPWTAGDWIMAHAEVQPLAERMFHADER